MTYFYAQLFTVDSEIRAMFPAAVDVQRRRFFDALSRKSQETRDRLVSAMPQAGLRITPARVISAVRLVP